MQTEIPEELLLILTRKEPQMRKSPKCIDACRETLKELATAEDIDATCIHETGHFIYAVELIIKLGLDPTQIEMKAPLVQRGRTLDGEECLECFEPVIGSVQTPFDSSKVEFTTTIVTMLARVAVAGGIFAGKFANRPNKGTGGDTYLFEQYYRKAHKKLHAAPDFLEASEYLTEAKEYVLNELDEIPHIGQLAKQIAEDYKLKHFRPFLAHATNAKSD